MPKLYISADLEGICWVTSPLQCSPEPDETAYRLAVDQLGLEVRTVIEAAVKAGATEIVVNDSHFTMANLNLCHLPESSSPKISLLSGKPKLCAMSAGLDASFDAAIYVGYHAKAGTENGILNHTFHSRIFDVSINGQSLGETGVNALYASLIHQVPVILVSGDQALCQEAKSFLPHVSTVLTKTSISTTAALSRPLCDVMNDYQQAVKSLFKTQESWKKNLLRLKAPYVLNVTFISSLDADCAVMLAPLQRVDGRTVSFKSNDFTALYQTLQASYAILSYANYLHY